MNDKYVEAIEKAIRWGIKRGIAIGLIIGLVAGCGIVFVIGVSVTDTVTVIPLESGQEV